MRPSVDHAGAHSEPLDHVSRRASREATSRIQMARGRFVPWGGSVTTNATWRPSGETCGSEG